MEKETLFNRVTVLRREFDSVPRGVAQTADAVVSAALLVAMCDYILDSEFRDTPASEDLKSKRPVTAVFDMETDPFTDDQSAPGEGAASYKVAFLNLADDLGVLRKRLIDIEESIATIESNI